MVILAPNFKGSCGSDIRMIHYDDNFLAGNENNSCFVPDVVAVTFSHILGSSKSFILFS